MKTTILLSLTTSALLTSATNLDSWDPSQKHWPNGAPADLLKRSTPNPSLTLPQILGVKKMAQDASEKFYPTNWITGHTIIDYYGNDINITSSQLPLLLKPAIRPSLDNAVLTPEGVLRLFKRQGIFTCPTGHYRCTSIARPNFCCGNEENCEIIEDGGIGDVGCCPKGQSCLGTVSNCGDRTACTKAEGGGCCVEGFRCTINGCVPESTPTTTTTTEPPIQTRTCEDGFYLCPASLGGGCCREGRICALNDCPANTSSTSTPTPTETPDNSNCPSGYYACSAEFGGGCCRVGRACGINSCPVADGGDIVGVVKGGTCAEGWYGCSAEKLGGCCPDGWECGRTDCPAQGANTPAAAKQNVIPGAGVKVAGSLWAAGAAVVVGVLGGMVL